ncbi:MAG: hypothetical protein HOP33_08355 [Verrucomicrobia bacterium]|nr:hypothetical protein [Verrucomicrobiota bacterium]
MIANFFQNLNASKIEYLLISGQATVLYGAATFSEDIDLWLNPTAENCDRFLTSLRACGARYYKLTPPFTPTNLQRGHGFHFVLGDVGDVAFLDVMGNPPRADSFSAASEKACWMQTEWGEVRTVGIKALVELKKTQRLEDYPIISKLALAWFDQPGAKVPDDFIWALENIFTLPELTVFFTEYPESVTAASRFNPKVAALGRQLLTTADAPESAEQPVRELFQQRIAELQMADRHYWRDIIGELKALRAAGKLMLEGSEI